MAEPTVQTYAMAPTAEGQQSLRARLYSGEAAALDRPLFVWFPAGDFTSAGFDDPYLDQVCQKLAELGYSSAVVEHRLGAEPAHLQDATRTTLPALQAEGRRAAPDLPEAFIGAPALAAMEDGAAFLTWAEANPDALGSNGGFVLAGISAGATTALNLVHVAHQLGFALPKIDRAVSVSGAFAYPSRARPTETKVLAIHGQHDAQISPISIRSYAYRCGDACTLAEMAEHTHGDLALSPGEPFRRSVRRLTLFEQGAEILESRYAEAQRPRKQVHDICVFTCVRNEGPFLLEWIAHNRAIGVTKFLIFSNDCDDGTVELLNALQARGIVTHVPNPSSALRTREHLNVLIANAPFSKDVRRADYAILTDVDEFIQIDAADGTLNGLIAAAGYPDVISLSELLFGFGGVEVFQNRLVTSQFRQSQPTGPDEAEQLRRGVKSIMRLPTCLNALANHRPRFAEGEGEALHWVDGSGVPAPKSFIGQGKRGMQYTGRYGLARVNHYTLRSGESMLVKFERGDSVKPDRMREEYFAKRDGAGEHNSSFEPHLPALKAELAELLKDPEVLRLHRFAVECHSGKVEALKADPSFAPVWGAIQEQVRSTHPGQSAGKVKSAALRVSDAVASAPLDPDVSLREEHVTYGSLPTQAGPQEMRARLFRTSKPGGPLLIWFHSGGFHTGTIDHPAHAEIAEACATHGISSAFVQYRLRCAPKDLSPKLQEALPGLIADAEAADFGLPPKFYGAPGLGATESGFLFLDWLRNGGVEYGLTGPLMLGGSSAGAIIVLNMLGLAPHFGVTLPRIEAAFPMSGAFAYPKHYAPNPTPIFALHNPSDFKVPIAPIRAFAQQAPEACTLQEAVRQAHGGLSPTKKEPIWMGIDRFVKFARDKGGRV